MHVSSQFLCFQKNHDKRSISQTLSARQKTLIMLSVTLKFVKIEIRIEIRSKEGGNPSIRIGEDLATFALLHHRAFGPYTGVHVALPNCIMLLE